MSLHRWVSGSKKPQTAICGIKMAPNRKTSRNKLKVRVLQRGPSCIKALLRCIAIYYYSLTQTSILWNGNCECASGNRALNFKGKFPGNFLESVRVVIRQESVRVGMWSPHRYLGYSFAFLSNLMPCYAFIFEILFKLLGIPLRGLQSACA